MKSILATISSFLFLKGVVGFTVPTPTVLQSTSSNIRNAMSTPRFTPLRSTPAENNEDEEGLDLNLEEMFTMFDAADKGVDFDKAIDQVKSEK